MRARKTGRIFIRAFTSSTFSSGNLPPYVTFAPSSRVGFGLQTNEMNFYLFNLKRYKQNNLN